MWKSSLFIPPPLVRSPSQTGEETHNEGSSVASSDERETEEGVSASEPACRGLYGMNPNPISSH